MAKKGTFPANAMRRGEIYWVDIPNAIGHELMKDRPAIIVSCDALNDNSPVVQVVYCSASPQEGAAGAHHHPLHRTDQHGPVRERVHRGQEPRGALRWTLHPVGDGAGGPRSPLRPGAGPVRPCKPPGGRGGAGAGTRGPEDGTASMALVIAQTERDTYKRMYESLLARMTMEREETA